MPTPNPHPLAEVEALLYDVFGTVVNWRASVTEQLGEQFQKWGYPTVEDWDGFTNEWRNGYLRRTLEVAQTGKGSTNIDIVHRELLDALLDSPSSKWNHLSSFVDGEKRAELTLDWHRLKGWPDSTTGLHELKKQVIISTLSNGSAKLLVDMAKYTDLPWDIIFSGDLLDSFKPNPKMYLGAASHLSLPPNKCAMVAAHIYDLAAAKKYGLRTVYVRRVTEDSEDIRKKVWATGTNSSGDKHGDSEGEDDFEVDVVVDSFEELAEVIRKAKAAS